MSFRCMYCSSGQRYGTTTWLPRFPSASTTYDPRKPVLPKTVATRPLTCAATPEG